jgi:NADPH:quinone reductase-like Zn-dependent oxidoreductase
MTPDNMRAVQAHAGAHELQHVEVPVPEPTDGDVLVKVAAAGVTPLDHSVLTGVIPFAQLPLTLGNEGSGRVVADPQGRWSEGDRVMFFAGPGGLARDGTYAEYAVVPVTNLAAIPAGIDDVVAATLPVAYLTAALALEQAGFGEGQSVLAPGIGGSVGNATAQLALAGGAARVISTAGSSAKAERARASQALAGVEVIDLQRESLAEGLARAAPGGVDVVIDALGGPLFTQSLASLAPGGRYVTLGYSAGRQATIDVTDVIWKGATVTGFSLFAAGEAAQAAAYAQVLPLIAQGRVTPAQDRAYPLDQASDALRRLIDERPFGKVALEV